MSNQNKGRRGASAGGSGRGLEKDRDEIIARDLGISMRFCLNLSFALIIAFPVFVLFGSQDVTPGGVITYSIPVIITIIFFLAFFLLLKRMENYATKKRNIDLVSRIIGEFNKSRLIRLAIGKIQVFMEQE